MNQAVHKTQSQLLPYSGRQDITPRMFISHATSFVKGIVAQGLHPDAWAVDATVGNGHDTLFMAETVGLNGRVFGFDIQQSALDNAAALLAEHGRSQQVSLFKTGHENMVEALPQEAKGKVQAVMFNCGFLPGGDGNVITRPETTCYAVDVALSLLTKSGIITMTMYSGHPGGPEELQAVKEHLAALDLSYYHVMSCIAHNHSAPKIQVFLIQKKR